MSLSEASSNYENLLAQANTKSEKKIYTRFKKIIDSLLLREFTAAQLQSLHEKLNSLQLDKSGSKASFHRKKFTEFTNYLEKEFSLIPEGHYTSMGILYGMIFGVGIGTAFGTAFGSYGISIGLSMGIGIGMALGIAYGNMKDTKAKKENRVLA